jgi:hypothetical protein
VNRLIAQVMIEHICGFRNFRIMRFANDADSIEFIFHNAFDFMMYTP